MIYKNVVSLALGSEAHQEEEDDDDDIKDWTELSLAERIKAVYDRE